MCLAAHSIDFTLSLAIYLITHSSQLRNRAVSPVSREQYFWVQHVYMIYNICKCVLHNVAVVLLAVYVSI